MKTFTVLLLISFLFLVFLSASLADVDLTPDNGSVAQNAQQQAPPIPLAPTPGASSNVPQQSSISATDSQAVQVVSSGIPVTGSADACTTQYIPVTGSCGVAYIPITGIPVTGYCSNPYVVNSGDTLSRLARTCGTSVAGILALNPSITNANIIYPGQVIWLYAVTGTQPIVPVTGVNSSPTVTIPVNPVVLNPSNTPILAGTNLQVSVSNFPANTPVDIGVGHPGSGYQVVNTGITDTNGFLKTTIVVPSAGDTQDQWVVMVVTTTSPITQSQSTPFTIAPSK
jgi:LysM repeat protein